nr:STM3941 family protein [Lactovum miscens]
MKVTEIKINFKKAQLSLFLLVMLFFIPIAFALFLTNNLLFIILASILLLFIFGIIILILRKLLNFKPALIISQSGLQDNTNHLKNPIIKWENIIGIGEANHGSQKLILIMVKDPEAFIFSENGSWQGVYKNSFELYGTPETISISNLQIKDEALIKLLNESLNKYGKSNKRGR